MQTFRYLRIKQTSPNMIGTNVLSISGWEFYGVLNTVNLFFFIFELLQDAELIPRRVVESKKQSSQRLINCLTEASRRPFIYKSDFDNNGILHFLGTNFGVEDWKNPGTFIFLWTN